MPLLAPQPPETQKKHRAHDKKTGCVPARSGLSLIFRPGSAPPPFSAASRPQARPASPRRAPKSLRAPDFGKIRPKKISNTDFGNMTGSQQISRREEILQKFSMNRLKRLQAHFTGIRRIDAESEPLVTISAISLADRALSALYERPGNIPSSGVRRNRFRLHE